MNILLALVLVIAVGYAVVNILWLVISMFFIYLPVGLVVLIFIMVGSAILAGMIHIYRHIYKWFKG